MLPGLKWAVRHASEGPGFHEHSDFLVMGIFGEGFVMCCGSVFGQAGGRVCLGG